ncbi:hypothetical protein GRF29_161g1324383 [Pseudopithomyces chartarum]|uniref:Protein kinase domain-containing protein n=1 Tax=Pseudopithomyces chartarum TaxID=1892770 RepID=A0AAN6LUI8_9PLEO|nr:hypothetical protein GRF29_161g1324383 [Pseudopithomyces chartarum]
MAGDDTGTAGRKGAAAQHTRSRSSSCVERRRPPSRAPSSWAASARQPSSRHGRPAHCLPWCPGGPGIGDGLQPRALHKPPHPRPLQCVRSSLHHTYLQLLHPNPIHPQIQFLLPSSLHSRVCPTTHDRDPREPPTHPDSTPPAANNFPPPRTPTSPKTPDPPAHHHGSPTHPSPPPTPPQHPPLRPPTAIVFCPRPWQTRPLSTRSPYNEPEPAIGLFLSKNGWCVPPSPAASTAPKLTRPPEIIREKVQDGVTGDYKDLAYTQCKIVGNGSFGVVFQTKLSPSGEDAAIKRVLQDKRFKNRELQIMRIVRHPNIVELKAFFYNNGDRPQKDEVYLNLVLEYVPETVYRASRYFNKMKTVMPILETKLYTYQLFRSLAYIHSQGICHRDIKPQNLLLDPSTGILKLCDFGSAKILVENEPNVSYICSRYYRAPELIFGATNYTTKIDVWSTGCVMAELMLGQPLFPGESGIDQLVEIIKVLGTPTRDQIRTMNPNYMEHKFPQIKPHPFNKVFRKADPSAIDLISKLLEYTPTQRLSAIDAMVQPFFDELRDPQTRLPDSRHPNGATRDLPELFNFTHHELSIAPQLNQQLVPQHIRPRLQQQGLDFESPSFKPLTKDQMMARLD